MAYRRTWIQSRDYAIAQKRDYNCYRHATLSWPAPQRCVIYFAISIRYGSGSYGPIDRSSPRGTIGRATRANWIRRMYGADHIAPRKKRTRDRWDFRSTSDRADAATRLARGSRNGCTPVRQYFSTASGYFANTMGRGSAMQPPRFPRRR